MLQASLSFIRSIKPALGLIFCSINKIYKVYAGNHFRAGFKFTGTGPNERTVIPISVSMSVLFYFFFVFFFLKTGDRLCVAHTVTLN